MKGERKLRLVPPPPPDPPPVGEALGGEPPFTPEEIAEAEALRLSLHRGEEPLAHVLRAAFSPRALGEEDLDALVKRALGDEAATTAAEREGADRLRAELEGAAPRALSAPLHALRLAARPTEIAPDRNEVLIAAAFRTARGRMAVVRRIAPVTMAALASVAALAAGVALSVGKAPAPPEGAGAATAALIRARSAEDLFDPATPFPRSGEESARVDRIAGARARDLRRNRFTSWGVR
jgi:hypothetical protein